MKKQVLSLLLLVFATTGFTQTATDFTANDCNGKSQNLFTQLDSGKVVAICWVMPCAACVGGALNTYNVVESFKETNPGQVLMYLCDDFANTSCTSLKTWANNNSLKLATCFSNAAINMSDYGDPGMPKIVVVGGPDHAVLYNANYVVNAVDLQNAIEAGLTTTGLDDKFEVVSDLNLFPNPASKVTEIHCNLISSTQVSIDLINLQGELIQNVHYGKLQAGDNRIPLDVSAYADGIYLLKISEGNKSKLIQF